jgi:hypothetical protein
MIAKEQHKLEVLKRRQEREIQQMLQYEITRKQLLEKQQKKIDALEVGLEVLRIVQGSVLGSSTHGTSGLACLAAQVHVIVVMHV